MKEQDFLILDTETTGLDDNAEIVEISVIDSKGNILMDTLVSPIDEIPEQAIAIHGITTEEARAKGRNWLDVLNELFLLVQSGEYTSLKIYNSAYDLRLIKQTSFKHGLDLDVYGDFCSTANDWCVMQEYAQLFGQRLTKPCVYTGRERGYKWQSLVNACKQQNLPVLKAHRALVDCQMTLNLINFMEQCFLENATPFRYQDNFKQEKENTKDNSPTENRLSA